MEITDLNGFQIQVTDLENAIEQAEWFKDAHHIPPQPSDGERQIYWNDVHQKLLKLKSEKHEQSSR